MAAETLSQVDPTFNLNEIHDALVEVAFRAGDIITGALPTGEATGAKKNSKSEISRR